MKPLIPKLEIRRKTRIFLIPCLGALSVEYASCVSNTPMLVRGGSLTQLYVAKPGFVYAAGVVLMSLLIAGTCWLTTI